jgi:putative ABC transport system permease protein
MAWIAWKMLTGNVAKYLGMVLGIAFAALLIAQQSSIFWGLMMLTYSQIRDIQGAGIWVMDPNMQYVDDIKPMSENELYRVRGVEGVQWAVRLYKGLSRARFPERGDYQQVILIGLDDDTFVGAPQTMVLGKLEDLRQPDAIFIDERGYRRLWPGEPFRVGRELEMNDRRAVIVGICKSSRTFMTFPIVYTRYSQATLFVPNERKTLSFVLAQNEPGTDPHEVCQRIGAQTGLKAQTREEFSHTTFMYYFTRTGIPMNFGITVVLGIIVGTAIAGQTFYLFTVENIRQFGTLKALGLSNRRIVGMILLQAFAVGLIGYGIGVGIAAVFGVWFKDHATLAFNMPWWVLLLTGAAVLLMVLVSSLLSIRRVLVLEPAVVFQTN